MRAITGQRPLRRAAGAAALGVLALAASGLGSTDVANSAQSLLVGRSSDGRALAAMTVDGKTATVYVIDTARALPVLRGAFSGTTARLGAANATGQVTRSSREAALRVSSGGTTQTLRLVPATGGDGLHRIRSKSGAVQMTAVLSGFEMRVAVSGTTSAGASATPTVRTVVAAGRIVEFPDRVLEQIERDRARRQQHCDLLEIQLGVLEVAAAGERVAKVTAEIRRVLPKLVAAFGQAAVKDGASAAVIATRTDEIREVIAALERSLKRTVDGDLTQRIAETRARAEELGCDFVR